jgi:hypothetical protein
MIKRIAIKGFKSLVDVSVDLGDVTVLIGRSGTGKTNFVHAIRFLRDYLLQKETSLQPIGGWTKVHSLAVPEATDQATEIRFDVLFAIPNVTGDFSYSLAFVGRNAGQAYQLLEESLSLNGNTLYHLRQGKWLREPSVIPAIPPTGLALDRISGIDDVVLAYHFLTSGIGCFDFSGGVLASPSRPNPTLNGGLRDNAENYLDVLDALVKDFRSVPSRRAILAAVKLLNGSIASVDLDMPSRQRVLVGYSFGGRITTMDLGQQSEGFRRFLAHLLALYQSPSKQTLIFEEPEKGIFPGALAALADEFKSCSTTGRGQVVLTTHSPELLNYFEPEQIRAVEIDGLATRVGPVSSEQLEALRERLLTPGELLTVDLARVAGVQPVAN